MSLSSAAMPSTASRGRRVVLGLDGGSTKTRCVVLEVRDDGEDEAARVLGTHTSGSCNHNSVGEARARRNVLCAMAGALRDAGPGADADGAALDVIGVCLCMSGTDRPRDKRMVAGWMERARERERRRTDAGAPARANGAGDEEDDLAEMRADGGPGSAWDAMMRKRFRFRGVGDGARDGECDGDGAPCVDVTIENDALGALCSGTRGERDGVVLIAGTGTIAYAFYVDEARRRRSARVSGWGAMFGDGGCGYDIGQKGLRTVARMLDGRLENRGLLPPAVLRAVGAEDAEGLLSWAYSDAGAGGRAGGWDRVASLARTVIECAQAGDADALGLVDDAAAELSRSVLTVVGKTAPGGGGGEGVWTGRVVLVGGVLAGASAGGGANVLLQKLLHNLHRDLPRAQIVTPTAEPAVGAAWLIAREAAGARGVVVPQSVEALKRGVS